jgi:natural product precursor
MKKLSKLKLNVLSEANLREREMNRLTGGERICTCSCYYANEGYSSSSNRNANYNIGSGGYSGNGCNGYWLFEDHNTHYCPECDEYFPIYNV